MYSEIIKNKYSVINDDLGWQLTYIGLKHGKIKKLNLNTEISILNNIIIENCEQFYNERVINYNQMVSDYTYFEADKNHNTFYFLPFIIEKNSSTSFCHVKIDEIGNYRFIKFNFTALIDQMCFYNYLGDIKQYLKNEITSKNGYNFYVGGNKKRFKSCYDGIEFYLKKANVKILNYSIDNNIIIGQNFQKAINKYLKGSSANNNLFYNNGKAKANSIVKGLYLSDYGNFIFVFEKIKNFGIFYNEMIPTLENSYDLIKQYFLMSEYFCSKYSNYNVKLKRKKVLLKDLEELILFEGIMQGLSAKSMFSVKNILAEFEKKCSALSFKKQLNRQKKYIIKERGSRKVSLLDFVSTTIAKLGGEIYGQNTKIS